VARRLLERLGAEPRRLYALDALQLSMESLTPAALSSAGWQSMALVVFCAAFDAGPPDARQLYAGGLLVFGYSTGITWSGDWHDELLDA